MSADRPLVPGPCCVGRNLNTWCADCEAARTSLSLDLDPVNPPAPIPAQNPSDFTPGTRVRGRRSGRIGHVVDAPLPERFDSQLPAVMVLWEGGTAPSALYTWALQALPPRTFSVLTIEIPIHHPDWAEAHWLAEGLLGNLPDEWHSDEEGEPGLWIDPADLTRAIYHATLTEPEVQS